VNMFDSLKCNDPLLSVQGPTAAVQVISPLPAAAVLCLLTRHQQMVQTYLLHCTLELFYVPFTLCLC
jgi:hypothetical protein